MVALQLLLIDVILEDGEFYRMVEDDDIIVFSAIFTFMKRNLQFTAIGVIYREYFMESACVRFLFTSREVS